MYLTIYVFNLKIDVSEGVYLLLWKSLFCRVVSRVLLFLIGKLCTLYFKIPVLTHSFYSKCSPTLDFTSWLLI